MKKVLFFIGLTTFFIACTPKTAEITESVENNETADNSGMPTTPIGQGKVIYLKDCSRCHEVKTVEEYTHAQWKNILPRMVKQAQLTDKEASDVKAYIEWELVND